MIPRDERVRRAAEALAHYFGGVLHSDDPADWGLDARIALDASGYPADLERAEEEDGKLRLLAAVLRQRVEDATQLWSCPECVFTFSADHEDEGGGYSCPACAETKLRADLERALDALRDAVRLARAAVHYALNEAEGDVTPRVARMMGDEERAREVLADLTAETTETKGANDAASSEG